jgi:hypothetical protein
VYLISTEEVSLSSPKRFKFSRKQATRRNYCLPLAGKCFNLCEIASETCKLKIIHVTDEIIMLLLAILWVQILVFECVREENEPRYLRSEC